MFRKWYHFLLKASVIRLVHVQKMVPFLVEGECNPFGSCSENGTISCLKASVILLVHVQKMESFNGEGECDFFGACSENCTISC